MIPSNTGAVRLGIWGGVAGGKTTFLGALKTSMLRDPVGGWSIVGQGDPDIRFLVDQQNQLDAGTFPAATDAPAQYRFHIAMPAAPTGPAAANKNRRPVTNTRVFDLEVHDYPGTSFQGAEQVFFEQLSEFLATCSGFLYLYDPTSNRNYTHFNETLQKLSARMREQDRARDNRVPQFMAVCITKYDDADVLARLISRGLVVRESIAGLATPTVSDARLAFTTLAEATDPNLPPSIRDYFVDARVAYFAVSSVGFYSRDSENVRLEDCCNVVDTFSGARIRGRLNPVNILSPLRWLENRIAA